MSIRSTLMAITKQYYDPPQPRDPEPENRGNKSRAPNPVTESPVGGWGFCTTFVIGQDPPTIEAIGNDTTGAISPTLA